MRLLPETGNLRHKLAVLPFPQLSRKPAIKTRQRTEDPTLRDPMENGAEATALQWTRGRRSWDITFDRLTQADWATLENFVRNQAKYGANIFTFQDDRDPRNPKTRKVRFAVIPEPEDADNTKDGVRQNVTFTIREV